MDEIESRRSDLVAEGKNGEDCLQPTGGAKQMASPGFCGAHRNTAGTTEYRLIASSSPRSPTGSKSNVH